MLTPGVFVAHDDDMTPTTHPAKTYTTAERDTVRRNASYLASAAGGGTGLMTHEPTVIIEYHYYRRTTSPTGLEVELAKWHRVGEDQWTLRRARGYTSIHSATDAVRTRRVRNWKIVR
jgi:hypothetical protein